MGPVAPGVPLATVPVGARVRLGTPDVSALGAAKVRRLAEIGLRRGMTVDVVSRTAGGGRILGVADGRVAVDRRIALGLPVEPSDAEVEPVGTSGR